MVKGHVRRWTLKTIRILISVVKYGPGALLSANVFVFEANTLSKFLTIEDRSPTSLFIQVKLKLQTNMNLLQYLFFS